MSLFYVTVKDHPFSKYSTLISCLGKKTCICLCRSVLKFNINYFSILFVCLFHAEYISVKSIMGEAYH